MVVELISVGTEILLGNIVNTNAAYLAEKCALLGCSLYHQTVVGDNEERMEEAIQASKNIQQIQVLTETIRNITNQTNLLAVFRNFSH